MHTLFSLSWLRMVYNSGILPISLSPQNVMQQSHVTSQSKQDSHVQGYNLLRIPAGCVIFPWLFWVNFYLWLQSIANLLGVTKSEASELLSVALGGSETNTPKVTAHSVPQLSVSSFLGCFEYTSAHQQGQETNAKNQENIAGSSRVVLPNTVGVRKGLSTDITIQLGKLKIYSTRIFFLILF